jgi:hypothetical protein
MKTSALRSLTFAQLAFGLVIQLGGCASEPPSEESDSASVTAALASRAAVATRTVAAPAASKTAAIAGTKSPVVTTATLAQPTVTPTVAPTTGGSGATSELEALHPWDVVISQTGGNDCRGILIHPSWVLTAAHCIGVYPAIVSYSRTDPTTNALSQDSRMADIYAPARGMFIPTTYTLDNGFGQPIDDIALIKLATPFNIDRNIQTAGMPRGPANPGRTGIVATNNHTTQPAGYTAVVRTPQLATADCTAPAGFVCITPPAGSICHGDSGSGFTELLDGRATVVGILSNMSVDGTESCIAADKQVELTDVYAHRDWILSTMGMSLEQVEGRVRVRASGTSTGSMSLTCTATSGPTVEVGMNVPGSEIGIDCDDASVVCQPASGQSLSGFGVRITAADGSVTTQSLPFLPAFTATYADPGATFQQYTCSVSSGLVNAAETSLQTY